jgi:tRNA (guanine-N7-)-methyltransferase
VTDSRWRPIRSFVRREGRLTAAQARAIETLWSRYGLEPGADLDTAFGRRAPRHLEIGFGNGDALLGMAEAHPDNDYLGIEVYRPGIGGLLLRAAERGLSNLRVIQGDAVEVLPAAVPDGALAAAYVFFPDPWPKKRHHKRRLIDRPFVDLLTAKLAAGGLLYVATDWADYAEQILAVLDAHPCLRNRAAGGTYAERPTERPLTRFESRGRRLGHEVFDLLFEHLGRTDSASCDGVRPGRPQEALVELPAKMG